VQRATKLLELLEPIRHEVWQYIVTLDDSRFYWEIDWEWQWLAEDDQPEPRTRGGIHHGRTMLVIFWDPNGRHLIDVMPKREKYSPRYYIDNILTPFCQRLNPAGKCKFVIHADNTPCHTANVVLDFASQRKVRFDPHSLYYPDIAPCMIPLSRKDTTLGGGHPIWSSKLSFLL
jgi:hypothetical protein